MCGIVGVFNLKGRALPEELDLSAALDSLSHRGPDDSAFFRGDGILLGATRLAIIDPAGGRQPVSDETGRFHLVMNGEIYDHDEKLAELAARGHRFRSRCDTEVAVHLFEERWERALDAIDGQFAIAVHDSAERRLLLARDEMGISPLFYAAVGDLLVFASEMKALFATGLIEPEIDPRSLDAVLAFGCVPAPRAVFKGVRALQPGRYIEASSGRVVERTYWDIPYPDAGGYPRKSEEEWSDELRSVLTRAARRRLRADVPVGIFLSGGIDSGCIAALVSDAEGIRERAFSIGFPEPGFDESARIERLARYLGFQAHILRYTQRELAEDLPRLVYHAETPMVSTESVPLMALSELARRHVKVVLTGEGSDEALGGYDYFGWEALKARCSSGMIGRAILSIFRRRFARELGSDNPFFPTPSTEAWAEETFGFYPAGMMQFFYWRRLREVVYSGEMLRRQEGLSDAPLLDLPRERMRSWDQLNRSLYVSSRVFMTNHLLGAHGDRALMANSVEGRYPFLDRGVQEFLATVPPALKTRWSSAKYLLRRAMAGSLPRDVLARRKKPFLAPFGTPFVGADAPEYARELLSERSLRETGFFDPAKVGSAARRLEAAGERLRSDRGESIRLDREVYERTVFGMALTAVLSTQVLADQVRRGEFGRRASRPGRAESVRSVSLVEKHALPPRGLVSAPARCAAAREPGSPRRSLGSWIASHSMLLIAPVLAFAAVCSYGETESRLLSWGAAWPLIALGLFLRVWAAQHSRPDSGGRPAFAATGPFALMRNPHRVGSILIIAGAVFLSELFWLAPAALVWSFGIFSVVARKEEDELLARHGEPYRRYLMEVPRWVPRASPFLGLGVFTERLWGSVGREMCSAMIVLPFIAKELVG